MVSDMFALFGLQLVLKKYRICLLSPETEQLYCIESLHLSGLHVMDTVLREAIKEMLCRSFSD